MEREFMEPVQGVIDTPFGPMSYTITQDDHVYLASGSGGSLPITVNRVEYHTTLHLFRKSKESWAERDFHDLYMRKYETINDEASSAARRKASEGIRAAWEAFIGGNEELLALAERSHLNNEIMGLEEEIGKIQGKLSEAEGKRSDLERQEEAVKEALKGMVRRGGWPAPKDWSPRGRVPGEGP